jgi:hypothetical protein
VAEPIHDSSPLWSRLQGVALIEVSAYLYIFAVYAGISALTPSVSMTEPAMQRALLLLMIALLSGLLAHCAPWILVNSLTRFGGCHRGRCFSSAGCCPEPGHALIVSMSIFAAVKLSPSPHARTTKAHSALELRFTLALMIEMALLLIGLFAARWFYPFA